MFAIMSYMKPLTPSMPHVIMMVGIPGAGKTTFAEHFAKTFSAPYLNPRTLSFSENIAVDVAKKVTNAFLGELLKTNRTLLYEGPTETRAERTAIIAQAKKAGYRTLLVWVQTEPVEAKRRATRRTESNTHMNAVDFKNSLETFQVPAETERFIVISGRHTYATQLKTVLKNLVREQPATQVPPAPRQSIVRDGRNITVR
jgi:predicted kinase